MKNNSSQTQLFIGLFIVLLGVVALINNLNFLNLRNVFHFWPTVFILFGLIKLSQPTTGKQRLWASLFIAMGGLMTLDNMGIIHFNIFDWWPLILIVVGVKMLLSDKHKYNLKHTEYMSEQAFSDNHFDITAVLGASVGSVTTQQLQSGDVTAMMGGAEIDLRNANMLDKAIIDITSIMGGVVLIIPRNWVVINQITPFLGGVENKTLPMIDAQKQLILRGTAFMGGVEIKN